MSPSGVQQKQVLGSATQNQLSEQSHFCEEKVTVTRAHFCFAKLPERSSGNPRRGFRLSNPFFLGGVKVQVTGTEHKLEWGSTLRVAILLRVIG